MPSHIYQRIGRYADAIKSNQMAAAADEDYITQCHAQGLYPMAYYPHNVHFIWFAASAEGQSKLAIESARKVAAQVTDSVLAGVPLLAGFRIIPYYALTRFGHWDEMLAEPRPSTPDKFVHAIWHYARGLSFVAKARRDDATRELDTLRTMLAAGGFDYSLFSPNTATNILSIAPEVLAGEIAEARGDHDTAIDHLEKAVRYEDALVYTEPEEWHYPPRLTLGAMLLAAGRAREAEVVYWEDLKKHPENGWALRGLADALTAEGKADEAAEVRGRFERAWARADVKLGGSRFSAEAR
jgi:tetratricopeptide (TPR) repeat protein